jgi:hypothetical protein
MITMAALALGFKARKSDVAILLEDVQDFLLGRY